MTKSEMCAKRDGIKKEKNGRRTLYLIPCANCGTIVKKYQYDSGKEYLCDYCKMSLKRKQKEKERLELNKIMTPKEQAFEKAVERMSKQVNISKYTKAINTARTRAEKFGSIPEAMVAIELLHKGYKIIPQQKIGRYKVDFAIPEEKIIVEVDGGTYHAKGVDGKREAIIQMSLGMEWNIIHIPADWTAEHIKSTDYLIKQYMLQHQVKK